MEELLQQDSLVGVLVEEVVVELVEGLVEAAHSSSGQFLRWYSSKEEHLQPDSSVGELVVVAVDESVVGSVAVERNSSGRILRLYSSTVALLPPDSLVGESVVEAVVELAEGSEEYSSTEELLQLDNSEVWSVVAVGDGLVVELEAVARNSSGQILHSCNSKVELLQRDSSEGESAVDEWVVVVAGVARSSWGQFLH
uniref:Uncharacterized protein n=1 Tax=Anopheles merus TaxID=30066 RepID=A0A182UXH8_ANOME